MTYTIALAIILTIALALTARITTVAALNTYNHRKHERCLTNIERLEIECGYQQSPTQRLAAKYRDMQAPLFQEPLPLFQPAWRNDWPDPETLDDQPAPVLHNE